MHGDLVAPEVVMCTELLGVQHAEFRAKTSHRKRADLSRTTPDFFRLA
jgi:hypothetical protein